MQFGSETKKARTYRLESKTITQIEVLQAFYSEKLKVKLSQADVIKMLVDNEFNALDDEKLRSIINKLMP